MVRARKLGRTALPEVHVADRSGAQRIGRYLKYD